MTTTIMESREQPRVQLSFVAERALRVLKAGGYFKAVRSSARGYERTYGTSLFTHLGELVEGIGYTDLQELTEAGVIAPQDRVQTPLWGENKAAIERKIYPLTLTDQPLPRVVFYTLSGATN